MRRIAPALGLSLILSACASETLAPVATPITAPVKSSHGHGRLIGMSIGDLGELFGAPSFQVREGPGLKLQYRGGGCVLDAYLYLPESGQGVERVTYIDARLASGVDTDAAACEAAIEAGR